MGTMWDRSSYRQGKNHNASSIVRIPSFSNNAARLGPTPFANRTSISWGSSFLRPSPLAEAGGEGIVVSLTRSGLIVTRRA